jgi:hypothetical protein
LESKVGVWLLAIGIVKQQPNSLWQTSNFRRNAKRPMATNSQPLTAKKRHRALAMDRGDYLRGLPQYVLLAAVFGAIAGALIHWIKIIPFDGGWRLLLLIPMAAVYVNAAVLPLAVRGRHWSFAFICCMLLFLMLIAGFILSEKLWFPHSMVTGAPPLSKVNTLSAGALLTGACLGLFYGLLSGKRAALIVGLIVGAITGYLLGLLSLDVVAHSSAADWDTLRYTGALNFAWQGAIALAALHFGACIGAMLGADPGTS